MAVTWRECKGKVILAVYDVKARNGDTWCVIKFTDGTESPRFNEKSLTHRTGDMVDDLAKLMGMK